VCLDNSISSIIVEPAFIYSSSTTYYYEETAPRYEDKFINCSVNSNEVFMQWNFKNAPLWTDHGGKYSQNITGLTIHNVSEDDYGPYSCLVNENGQLLNATISLTIICKWLCVYMYVFSLAPPTLFRRL